jgi:hypothetical protein
MLLLEISFRINLFRIPAYEGKGIGYANDSSEESFIPLSVFIDFGSVLGRWNCQWL